MKKTCPLGSKCREVDESGEIVAECQWLVTLLGTNPQTGESANETACAVKYIPILQVENTAKVAGVQAATESFRNEMMEGNVALGQLFKALPESG